MIKLHKIGISFYLVRVAFLLGVSMDERKGYKDKNPGKNHEILNKNLKKLKIQFNSQVMRNVLIFSLSTFFCVVTHALLYMYGENEKRMIRSSEKIKFRISCE